MHQVASHHGKKNIRIQLWAVIIGLLLLVIKALAFYLTNSNAILTDALESIINVLAGSMALYSLYVSAKPRDRDHPYGHGKIEFLSAGLEGALIMVAGLFAIGKSIYNFYVPYEIHSLDIGMGLTTLSGVVNMVLGVLLVRQGKRSGSHALVADGQHLKSDAYTTAGLFVGLLLIYLTGIVWLDNVVAILFGLLLGYMGIRLMRSSLAGVMDEADEKLVSELLEKLNTNRHESWVDLHNLRIIKYGSKLHIDCHLTLPWYIDLEKAHDLVKEFEDEVKAYYENQVELFVHSDPCVPESCAICIMKNCSERKQETKEVKTWNLKNTYENQRHQ